MSPTRNTVNALVAQWLLALVGCLVLLSGCADTRPGNGAQDTAKFRCNPNGIYEERKACQK